MFINAFDLNSQVTDTCPILVRSHSFGRGITHYFSDLNGGNFYKDSVFFDYDTIINNKVYFRWLYCDVKYSQKIMLCAEDEYGNIWDFHRSIGEERIVIPARPFIGYKVSSKGFTSEIMAINLTQRFGKKTFTNLVKLKRTTPGGIICYHYFKPGVGWVATSNHSLTVYLYCVKYPSY
jgi:hypothetical protein